MRMHCRILVTAGAAMFAAAVCIAAGPGISQDDEKLLKSAQIGTDGPALLAYLKQRTIGDAERSRIESLIRQLGSQSYAIRERATNDLVTVGVPAIGPLRHAQLDQDIEVARRAERCLQRIEKVPSSALSAAVARSLGRTKPAGASEALLAFLPMADDESVADEIREALSAVAIQDGRHDPLLEKAISDASPVKRAAAAEALIRTGQSTALEVSRKTLTDPDSDVRLRSALAFVTKAKDKQAMPALIGLLAEMPQGAGWRIEDVLVRLAGDGSPKVPLGADDASRHKCRDAWLDWWRKNGASIDLAKLDTAPPMLGNTLIVLRERTGGGKVMEVNANKEILWKIDNLQLPTDAVVVGKDRVLIAEQNSYQISERDFSGKVIWTKQMNVPVGVQRLPNGNTFVVCRNQLVELDGRQREIFNHPRNPADIMAGFKSRNGEMTFVTTTGNCFRLDAKGKEIKNFPVVRMAFSYGGLEVLPNNHVLVTQRDNVAEYDANGKQVWSTNFSRPTSVQRLPNGNTLVSSGLSANSIVAELDQSGKPVWEYKPPDNAMPYKARRR